MSIIQQPISAQMPLSRRRALIGLSLLALTACSRSSQSPKSAGSNVAYYTCTMHPFVRSHDPDGKCPVCGMNLVAVSKVAADSSTSSAVYIEPKRLQEMGAKSEIVTEGATSGGLRIPAKAVLPTGNKSMVFVDHGSGQIEPREVQLAGEVNGYYDVISGLKEGERVFVSANFLIDAECRIQGVLKTWGEKP